MDNIHSCADFLSAFFAAAGHARQLAELEFGLLDQPNSPRNLPGQFTAVELRHPIIQRGLSKSAEKMRRYRERLKQNPQRRRHYLQKQHQYNKKYSDKIKQQK